MTLIPGVDVMITIFCNFRQKKIGVFLKNLCYDQTFAQFTFVLSQKARSKNNLEIVTSVPGIGQGSQGHSLEGRENGDGGHHRRAERNF
jgi:hypothetical protein